MADGIHIVPPDLQGGVMASSTLTNLRRFPTSEPPSKLDAFLIRIGAKEMTASTKKETDGAVATKWNQSVLGLAATILVLVSALVTVVVNYTSLSANFTNYQKVTDEKMLKLEQKIEKIEDFQRQDSLRKAEVRGYQLGATETKQKEEEKK